MYLSHGLCGSLVDAELEDVGAGIVADDVEVELAARDVAQVEVRAEDAFFAQQRARHRLAERTVDRGAGEWAAPFSITPAAR